MNEKTATNKYYAIIKQMHSKIPKYITFILMQKEAFTDSELFYFFAFLLRFIGIFILCGNFSCSKEELESKSLSKWFRYFTMHRALKIISMHNLLYNILSCVVFFVILTLGILYAITLIKLKRKQDLQNITITGLQIFLDHLLFMLFPFLLEFCSFILYIILFPESFLIRKQSDCAVFNYIICAINIISILLLNFIGLLQSLSINRPVEDNSPFKYNFSTLKFWICFLLQNFVMIESLELYLNESQLNVYRYVIVIFFIAIFIMLFIFSLKNFNYDTSINFALDICANFSFFSIFFEIVFKLCHYTYGSDSSLFFCSLMKLCISFFFEYVSRSFNSKILMNVAKTEMFKVNKENVENLLIFNSFFYVFETIKGLTSLKNKNAQPCFELLFKHQDTCFDPECKCRLIQIIPYGKQYKEDFTKNFIERIGFFIESAFVQLDFRKDYNMTLLLSEHYFYSKANPIMAYAMFQTLLAFNYKSLNLQQIITGFQSCQKYIVEAKKLIELQRSKDMSADNIVAINLIRKENYFTEYYKSLEKIKKIKKQMLRYTQNYLNVLLAKETFEDNIKFKKDEDSGEILSIYNSYLSSQQLGNIIEILKKERTSHVSIINLIKKLSGLKLCVEFYYKCFVFVELFFGGKIDDDLIQILYSFTNDRNLYCSNVNPNVFIVLKQRYFEHYFLSRAKHDIIFNYSKGMKITYFSDTLASILKYKQENLANQSINVLLPEQMAKPHSNLLLSYLIHSQTRIFPTIHNFLFNKNNQMIPSKFTGVCLPGLGKNLITIMQVQLIEGGKEFLIAMDSKFNVVSLSENFDDKFALSLPFINKFNINLLKLFDIKEEQLLKVIEEFKRSVAGYKHNLEIKPGEYFTRRLFNEIGSSSISKFTLFDDIDKIYKGNKNDAKFLAGLKAIKRSIESIYVKKDNAQLEQSKFRVYKKKKNILQNFVKLAEQFTEVDVRDKQYKKFNEFTLKVKSALGPLKDMSPRKKARTSLGSYEVDNLQGTYQVTCLLKLMYDTPFYFFKIAENYKEEKDAAFTHNLLSTKTQEKLENTLETNRAHSLARTTTKSAVNKRAMAQKGLEEKSDNVFFRYIVPLILSMLLILLVVYIIVMFYQNSTIDVNHKIFLILFYNYFQRDKFYNMVDGMLSYSYGLLGITNSSIMSEEDSLFNIKHDIKEFERAYHLYYSCYVDFKLARNQPLTTLYEEKVTNHISMTFENIETPSNYLREVEYISYLAYYGVSVNFRKDKILSDLNYFFHGKFLENPSVENNGRFIRTVYYMCKNFNSFFVYYYNNLQEDIEIQFDSFAKSSKKIYVILEVLGFLCYIFFFLLLYYYLNEINRKIFTNIINIFIDFTQEGNYNFKNKIDNVTIAKKLKNFKNLLTNFNMHSIDVYNSKATVALNESEDESSFEFTTKSTKKLTLLSKKTTENSTLKQELTLSKNDLTTEPLKKKNDIISNLNAAQIKKKKRHLSNSISVSSQHLSTNQSILESKDTNSTVTDKKEEPNLPAELIADKIENKGIYKIKVLYGIVFILFVIVIIYFFIKVIISLDFSTQIKSIFDDFGAISYRSSSAYEYFDNLRILFLIPQFGQDQLFATMAVDLQKQVEKVQKILNSGIENYPKTNAVFDVVMKSIKESEQNKKDTTDLICQGDEHCLLLFDSDSNIFINGLSVTLTAMLHEIENMYKDYKKLNISLQESTPEFIREHLIGGYFEKIDLVLNFILKLCVQRVYSSFKDDESLIVDSFKAKIKILNSCGIICCVIIGLVTIVLVVNDLTRLSQHVEESSLRLNKSFCYIKITDYEEIQRTKTIISSGK